MERRVGVEDVVGRAASAAANGSVSRNAPSLVACMCAKSSTGRTQVVRREISSDVVERAEIPHAPHHLDAERHRTILPLEPLAERSELLDDRVERILAAPFEQEAGMEDDQLGATRRGDTGAAVERARPPR